MQQAEPCCCFGSPVFYSVARQNRPPGQQLFDVFPASVSKLGELEIAMTPNQQLDTICAHVHGSFVTFQQKEGNSSYQSHDSEELMVPWNQLSDAAKNRYRQFCQWYLSALEDGGVDLAALQQPKTKTAGA